MLEFRFAYRSDVDLAWLLAGELRHVRHSKCRSFVSEHQDLVFFVREETRPASVGDYPTHGALAVVDVPDGAAAVPVVLMRRAISAALFELLARATWAPVVAFRYIEPLANSHAGLLMNNGPFSPT